MRILLSTLLLYATMIASSAHADTWFTLADYKALKERDPGTSELVLKAMREAVYYAQESVGGPVICASPIPIDGAQLTAMLEDELANPTNARGRDYTDSDQIAFIFIHALKKENACK